MMRIAAGRERLRSLLPVILLVAALAAYLVIGLTNLNLPGLQYDEVADAVPAMELLRGLPSSAFSNIDLFGLRLPLMISYYIGPTTIYVSWAGMAVFGTTVAGLRITLMLLGVVILCLIFVLARSWFDPLTAGISTLLCATAPAFIWWSRAGANFTLPILSLAILELLLVRRWWRTRHSLLLVAAGFIVGLGLTTKLLFYWQVISLGLTAVIVLGLPGAWKTMRSIPVTTLLASAIACLAGLSPFIIYNIPSGASFQFIAANALQSHVYGHSNLDIFNNLQAELGEFLRMMGGDTLHFDAPAGLPFGTFAIIISVIYTAALCIRYRSVIAGHNPPISKNTPVGLRLRLLLLITVTISIPLGTISVSSIGARHLFIIVPLAWLLVGLSIVDCLRWLRDHLSHRPALALSALLVAILPLNAVVTNALIQSFMLTSGGRGLWSDAIYTLADTLSDKYAGRPIMALDWGFGSSVTFLTQGKVRMKEMYEYLPEPSPRFADMATVMLRDPANVYVFHPPESTAFQGYMEAMQRQAVRQHKQLVLAQAINERNGAPNTLIYTAESTPRSFKVSPTLATRNAVFSGGLTLLGGSANYDPAKHEIAVQLYWQNTVDHQSDDTVLMHLVNQSTGEVILNADQQPLYGSYPFSQWQKGEVVTDLRWITLPSRLEPGVYQVRVGIYDTKTGIRRGIDDPLRDAAGNSLMLHSIEIK